MLVLSSLPEQSWLPVVADAGALGFVSKDDTSAALVVAVQALCAGDNAFTPAQLRLLRQPRLAISKREHEVLTLLAEGLSNKQIAAQLGISVGTVRKHVENLSGLFDVHSRGQIVAAARQCGLLMSDA